jgi:hypothetical protein
MGSNRINCFSDLKETAGRLVSSHPLLARVDENRRNTSGRSVNEDPLNGVHGEKATLEKKLRQPVKGCRINDGLVATLNRGKPPTLII